MSQQPLSVPRHAMILAAGLGERMRPLTERLPKPLVKVAGKPLIDYALDQLARAGVESAVVNLHHFADLLQDHLARRTRPRIVISDERQRLLGTGAGVVNALPLLGQKPFFHINSDSIWIDGAEANLRRLAAAYDPAEMDALLLLAPAQGSIGYGGRGDFAQTPDGRLRRAAKGETVPFVYSGAAILSPVLFAGRDITPFPLTEVFESAARAGRLHGLVLDGIWMHVGTPDAIALAEAAIFENAA